MKKTLLAGILFAGIALFGTNSAYADFSFNDIELRFAQVSDTHLSDSDDTTYKVLSHSKELLHSAIVELNKANNLDFVVFTGDMVNEPTKQYYKDFLVEISDLKFPALLVFGNHDARNDGANPDYLTKEEITEIIQKSNPYQDYGMPYFAYSPTPEYRVIVLDTSAGYEGKSNGYLPEDQAAFLDREIAGNTDKVILIFQHHPLIEPFKSGDHKILNSDQYMSILKKYPKVPIGIFTGHYHAAKIVTRGNIVHVTSPALVTYPNAYRTVKVTNYHDRVIFNFYFHETALSDIQQKSKAGLVATTVFNGMPSDRNTEVMIRKGYVPKEKISKEELQERKALNKLKKQEEKAAKQAEKAARKAEKEELKAAKKAAKKR